LTAVIDYHDLVTASKHWAADYNWVKGSAPKYSGIFDEMIPEQMLGHQPTPFANIVKNVIAQFDSTPFWTTFTTLRAPTTTAATIVFQDVLGKVAGTQWISDRVLNFLMNKIVEGRQDVYIMDPLQTSKTTKRPPAFDIRSLRFIVHPQNVDGVHWVVTLFEFEWGPEQDNVKIHMYDPMGSRQMVDVMLATWKSFTLEYVESWLARDHPGATLSNIIESVPDSPRQKDGCNCGFLCIVLVSMIVNGRAPKPELMKKNVISDADLAAFRYKILHLLIVDCERVEVSARVNAKVEYLHAQIAKYMP
jgi:Ulp1 family protease